MGDEETTTNDKEEEEIVHKLSTLGLKNNIRRSHTFQLYETQSLQQQAYFNNNDTASSPSSRSFLAVSSSNFRPFGSNTFCANDDMQTMRWPKSSIFAPSDEQEEQSMSECASQSNAQ